MLYRLYGRVKFNRPLTENEHPSFGGFEFTTKDGKTLNFDFQDSESGQMAHDPSIVEFELRNPDLVSFPDIPKFTLDDFKNISKVEEFYVDLEDCKDDLKIISASSTIEYDSGDKFIEVKMPDVEFNDYEQEIELD